MNQKGNNWAFVGKKNTGKTHEAMAFAHYFNERSINPKRIIVFDHSNNSSYEGIEVIDMNRLRWQLPQRAIVKVQSQDFDTFADIVLNCVRNAVIVIDDSSAYFRNNVNKIGLRFLKSPKNNANEYFFQIHSLNESAPLFLQNVDMFVLKESRDIPERLDKKVPYPDRIGILLREVTNENKLLEKNKLWATRVFDMEEDTIWRKFLNTGNSHVLETYEVDPAKEYLKLY